MGGFGVDIFTNLIGGKPSIPAWNTVSLGQSQTQAINENTASLPALENLSSQTNQFNVDQIQKMLKQVIPGYQDITSSVSGTIQSLLKGEVPTDVANTLQSSDAAKALTGGFGGSGIAGNLFAKDLGLTSLDLVTKGLSTAQSWLSTMANINQPGMFNLSSMFVSPQQQFQDTFQNQEAQFQRDYASNMNDFAYSFRQAAAKDFNSTANTVLSLAESYLGGGMGGMMGGGGGGGDLSGTMSAGASTGSSIGPSTWTSLY